MSGIKHSECSEGMEEGIWIRLGAQTSIWERWHLKTFLFLKRYKGTFWAMELLVRWLVAMRIEWEEYEEMCANEKSWYVFFPENCRYFAIEFKMCTEHFHTIKYSWCPMLSRKNFDVVVLRRKVSLCPCPSSSMFFLLISLSLM